MLESVLKMIDDVNATNSINEKVARLKKFAEDGSVSQVLHLTYNPYIKHHLTSENLVKNSTLVTPNVAGNIFFVLNQLSTRAVTGHAAIGLANGWIQRNPEYKELFYRIIDGNLKIRMDASSINKAIPHCVPTFDIPLAEKFTPEMSLDLREWYGSRKLDGVRCLTVDDSPFSRVGKAFETLDVIKACIKKLQLKDLVFDGEVCIVDENGNENFTAIQRQIARKNHTIVHPKYLLFDVVSRSDFDAGRGSIPYEERYQLLKSLIPEGHPNLEVKY